MQMLLHVCKSDVLLRCQLHRQGVQAAAAEVPPGKAAVPPLYYARTNRTDLSGILQQHFTTPAAAQDAAAAGKLDDTWLAYRGRRVVPGPELRRGRKNLHDVVHHTCVEGLRKNPHFTGAR